MRCLHLHLVGLWLLIVTFGASSAVGLSIFDVIQLSENGYGDPQIIDLIDATGSVFELEAQDVPRLKQLGVGEVVIRAMLERLPEERSSDVSRSDPASPGPQLRGHRATEPQGGQEHAHERATAEPLGGQEHTHARTGDRVAERAEHPRAEERAMPGGSAPSFPDNRPSARPGPRSTTEPVVSFHPFEEEQGGDHLHMVLTLSGLELLVLRDEGSFPSLQARAMEVAQRLEAALALGEGTCYPVATGWGPTVVFQSAATRQRITVIKVTIADAHAYGIRSGRRVTPDLLAAYWSDLLSDFIAIAMGRRPNRTLTLHDGDALGVLYQALRSSVGQGGGLRAASELLPTSVKHHLERLAAAVPVDYDRAEWDYQETRP